MAKAGINILFSSYYLVIKSSASLKLDRYQRLTYNVTFSLLDHISSVFMDRFEHSFRFCHLEFEKEPISDGCRSENGQFLWGDLNFK